jgi:hypothetical protein
VLAQVMTQGLVLTGIGVVAGLVGAAALNRLIASLLFGVRPTDPRRSSRSSPPSRSWRPSRAGCPRGARRADRTTLRQEVEVN